MYIYIYIYVYMYMYISVLYHESDDSHNTLLLSCAVNHENDDSYTLFLYYTMKVTTVTQFFYTIP